MFPKKEIKMRKEFSTMISVVCGVTLLVLLLFALGSTSQTKAALVISPSNNVSDRPLVVALNTNPPTLDYNIASDTRSHAVLAQLIEGLYRYRLDGSVEPAGAVSYTVSPDGLVYVVNLRAAARWSDGEAVTAQHYVDGVRRLLDPDLDSALAWLAYVIAGAEDYHTGVVTDPSTVGVTAVNSTTVQFTLAQPAGHFLSLMAMQLFYPVRLDIIESDPAWTAPGHFVGNGSYVLTDWKNDQIFLDQNPFYHSVDQVDISQVIFSIIPSYDDQLAAYRNDQLDVLDGVGYIPSDPVLLAERHRAPRPGVYYLGVNTELTPTRVVTVRKALAAAINRNYLLTDVLQMSWREGATSVIPPSLLGYQNKEVGYTFNPTQARSFLAQAGYPGGAGFPGVELWANYGNEDVINTVAEQWQTNLGISVTTVYTNWSLYLDILDDCTDDPSACDYNVYRLGWVVDYADAENLLNTVFHPDSPFQHTGWDNARYRQLMDFIVSETDQVSRTAYLQEADRILVEDEAVVIPLFYYDRIVLVKSDVLFEYPPVGAPYYMNWRIVTVSTGTIPVGTAAGGVVNSPDGDIEVEFPPQAIEEAALVTYTAFFLPPYPPTGTFSFAGNGFVLDVTDLDTGEPITTFAKPLTVTIDYTEGELDLADEDTLELMYWDGSLWSTDGITIVERDKVNDRLVIQIGHLTEFALFGQRHYVYLPLILRND
jgi:oligopeptide transport system substrate-binding protein